MQQGTTDIVVPVCPRMTEWMNSTMPANGTMVPHMSTIANKGLLMRGTLSAIGLLALQICTPALAQPVDGPVPRFYNQQERTQFPSLGDLTRIRFLTTVDFPPFNSLDPQGRLTGFNIDLVNLICGQLAVKNICQIEAVPWNELEPRLAAGNAEAIIAGLTPQVQNRTQILFSRPYMRLPARFVTSAHNPPAITEQGLRGKRIAVLGNTLHADLIAAYFPSAQIQSFNTQDDMFAALRDGHADALFGDGLSLIRAMQQPENAKCCLLTEGAFLAPGQEAGNLSIAVNPRNAALLAAIDNAIQALERRGAVEELYLRYFPTSLY